MLLVCRGHVMATEKIPERNRRSLIKKDTHGDKLNFRETTLGVFEHRVRLQARHTRKPSDEIFDGRPTFEIFEKSAHRNTRTLEKPCAADFPGDTLHDGTL